MCFFFQAEDGIRYLVRSRGLGDVYKRQGVRLKQRATPPSSTTAGPCTSEVGISTPLKLSQSTSGPVFGMSSFSGCSCLLYTSDAADERSSVDLGGRRIINKKKKQKHT